MGQLMSDHTLPATHVRERCARLGTQRAVSLEVMAPGWYIMGGSKYLLTEGCCISRASCSKAETWELPQTLWQVEK